MISPSDVADVNLSASSPLLDFHPHRPFTGSRVNYFYFLVKVWLGEMELSTEGTHCTLKSQFKYSYQVTWLSVVQQPPSGSVFLHGARTLSDQGVL